MRHVVIDPSRPHTWDGVYPGLEIPQGYRRHGESRDLHPLTTYVINWQYALEDSPPFDVWARLINDGELISCCIP